jgi:hypothetical protein
MAEVIDNQPRHYVEQQPEVSGESEYESFEEEYEASLTAQDIDQPKPNSGRSGSQDKLASNFDDS